MNRPQFTDSWIILGLASTPAHKVIEKWVSILGPAWIESVAPKIARGVRSIHGFEIPATTRPQRAFCAELILALGAWRDRNAEVRLATFLNSGKAHNQTEARLAAIGVSPLFSYKELATVAGMAPTTARNVLLKWRQNYRLFCRWLTEAKRVSAEGDEAEREFERRFLRKTDSPPAKIVPRKRKKSVR